MLGNKWQFIWSKKGTVTEDYTGDEFQRFCELKKANGFDVAVENKERYYRSFYNGWIEFFNTANELTDNKIKSVFEVGCGNGVNLFMLKNRIQGLVLGGCDYSETMVENAKLSTGCDDFYCYGAHEISIEPKYDLVMAESVFQYFESEEYAVRVLRKMIEKTNHLTYLGEIHNKIYEHELMEYRRKTIEDYEERYRGLNKLFLSKEMIESVSEEYGKKVIFTEVNNTEYLNGKYEYNCYIF